MFKNSWNFDGFVPKPISLDKAIRRATSCRTICVWSLRVKLSWNQTLRDDCMASMMWCIHNGNNHLDHFAVRRLQKLSCWNCTTILFYRVKGVHVVNFQCNHVSVVSSRPLMVCDIIKMCDKNDFKCEWLDKCYEKHSWIKCDYEVCISVCVVIYELFIPKWIRFNWLRS